jgi:formyl-CoA transferase
VDKATFYREARTDLPGPLAGVRVLDVTMVWSGPMTAAVLADLGADVVRVEMPGNREGQMPPEIPGTGLSWFRQTVNRNKRSVGLDLRVPEARDVFRSLVRTADVVVENFTPGTMEQWGVGYAACRAEKPDIVYVSISGWGQFGPESARRGYDPIAQAFSGWMSLNGAKDGGPAKAPTFLSDDMAGLNGAIGALAALRHRDLTGEGQHVDVSLLDSLLAASVGFPTLGATGVPLERWGAQSQFLVPCDVYACLDAHVYVAIALDKDWRALAGVIGRPDLATAPGFATNRDRVANRDTVNAVVAAWCAPRAADDVVAAVDAGGVIVSRIRTFAEAAKEPHVLERDMLQDTVLCNGTTAPIVGPPVKFSRTPTRVRAGAPEPGAHTAQVLAEAGIDETGLAALRVAGAT